MEIYVIPFCVCWSSAFMWGWVQLFSSYLHFEILLKPCIFFLVTIKVLVLVWLPVLSMDWAIVYIINCFRDPYVLQGVLLVSCEEMMSFTSCLQNWLIGTSKYYTLCSFSYQFVNVNCETEQTLCCAGTELVGTPDCFGLEFEWVMLHQWPISSKSLFTFW